jgi:hypothetical protein
MPRCGPPAAGLVGRGALPRLSAAVRRGLVAPGADVLPAAATLYCLPLEVLAAGAPGVQGVDLSPLNRYRCGTHRKRALACLHGKPRLNGT